ncbi:MAG TPA: LytTR family DNA-binding domain-containing protein [Longimicrobiales bacterium]|nr:LytTR family DNA-binding domain-containing protein [Longimicrobiales bacterium]
MPPRVIIIDDEQHARRKIRQFLEAEFDVEVVGEFSDRDSAVTGIRTLDPELVFLDVQLRAATGFDVLEEIGPESMPATVFVTAYDEYAVRAFEVHAVDYLLKPFDRQRFRTAMERALARLAQREASSQLLSLLQEVRAAVPAGRGLKWILVKRRDQSSVLLQTTDIHWIEAAGNYVYLHTGTGRYLHRDSLGMLSARLDPTQFVRVHRSAIVNFSFIQQVKPWGGGDYEIRMTSGDRLRLSRHYREAFDRALERS